MDKNKIQARDERNMGPSRFIINTTTQEDPLNIDPNSNQYGHVNSASQGTSGSSNQLFVLNCLRQEYMPKILQSQSPGKIRIKIKRSIPPPPPKAPKAARKQKFVPLVAYDYECPHCSTQFLTKHGIDNHLRKFHSEEKQTGTGEKIPSKIQSPAPAVSISDSPVPIVLPFPCEACKMSFQIRPELMKHMIATHRDTHECCELFFTTRADLEYHKSTHSDEVPDNESESQEDQISIMQIQSQVAVADQRPLIPDAEPNSSVVGANTVFSDVSTDMQTDSPGPSSISAEASFPIEPSAEILPDFINSKSEPEVTESLRNKKYFQIGKKRHNCSLCVKSFLSSKNLNRHLARTHQLTEKRYSCGACSRRFFTKYDCEIHALTQVKCTYCSAKFCTMDSMQSHAIIAHQGLLLENQKANQKFKCRFCDNVYAKSKSRTAHECRIHGKGKRFVCEYCQHGFNTAKDRNEHARTHTEERTFPCPFCPVQLLSFRIGRHIERYHFPRTRTEQRRGEFLCSHCNLKVQTELGYIKHSLIHHGIKQAFKCSFKSCRSTFTKGANLQKHMVEVHFQEKEKQFQCQVCDKKFDTKFQANKHLPSHRSELPHNCSFCNAGYRLKCDLYQHVRLLHTKKYICKFCKKGFNREAIFQKHSGKCHDRPSARSQTRRDMETHEENVPIEDQVQLQVMENTPELQSKPEPADQFSIPEYDEVKIEEFAEGEWLSQQDFN